MKNYHPASWSQQARELAERQFKWYVYYQTAIPKFAEDVESYKECSTEAHYANFFSNSYRHPLIKGRAAKRFGKMVRKYKREVQ